MFRRKLYEPSFLHLAMLGKALESLTKTHVPHDQQGHSVKTWARLHCPFSRTTYASFLPRSSSSELSEGLSPGPESSKPPPATLKQLCAVHFSFPSTPRCRHRNVPVMQKV